MSRRVDLPPRVLLAVLCAATLWSCIAASSALWAQGPAVEPVSQWQPWGPTRLAMEPAEPDRVRERPVDSFEPSLSGDMEDLGKYDDVAPPEFLGGSSIGGWEWQLMPSGILYRSYLAGVKESRMQSSFTWFDSGDSFWEATVGGRIPFLRYGTLDPINPEGFQVDGEGAAIVRLDVRNNIDLVAVDFRGGLVVSFGDRRSATKVAYYHMSSHVGDEFLLANPAFTRLNWSRDTFVIGRSLMLTPSLRLYGEVGWAFYTDVSEPWEFQFGAEYAPAGPTGPHGAPFAAINAHLRQEVDFGGSLTVQTGWAWRSKFHGSLLRMGFQYYNGKSSQYSFYNMFEQQFTIGVWYDY